MAIELQNPGPGEPTKLSFDTWPHPAEFFVGGGTPGVEYVYLCPEELPDAQDRGWSTIANMKFFKIRGVAATAVARGTPIPGAKAGSSICKWGASDLLIERVGLQLKPSAPPSPEDTLEAAIIAAKAANQKSKVSQPSK
jgi:hypothetical protein